MKKERRADQNIGSHKERMKKRKKLRGERQAGFLAVYTKKQIKEFYDAEQRRKNSVPKL